MDKYKSVDKFRDFLDDTTIELLFKDDQICSHAFLSNLLNEMLKSPLNVACEILIG